MSSTLARDYHDRRRRTGPFAGNDSHGGGGIVEVPILNRNCDSLRVEGADDLCFSAPNTVKPLVRVSEWRRARSG